MASGKDEYLNIREAAEYLGVSPDFLYALRRKDKHKPEQRREGPKFVYIAEHMSRYKKEWLDEWAQQRHDKLSNTPDCETK